MDKVLESELNKLKDQFVKTDVFCDNSEELYPIYMKLIDSVKETDNSINKIKILNDIKKQFYDDDLLYGDEDEIEESEIFIIIDKIVRYLK